VNNAEFNLTFECIIMIALGNKSYYTECIAEEKHNKDFLKSNEMHLDISVVSTTKDL
jgi:hypothetical protein